MLTERGAGEFCIGTERPQLHSLITGASGEGIATEAETIHICPVSCEGVLQCGNSRTRYTHFLKHTAASEMQDEKKNIKRLNKNTKCTSDRTVNKGKNQFQ